MPLSTIAAAAALSFVALAPIPVPSQRQSCPPRMAATLPDPFEDDPDDLPVPPVDGSVDSDPGPWDMAELSLRVQAVQEAVELETRLEALPCAWVLVYDADTEDEAVYSMEVGDGTQHVVLAFEDREEAEAYSLSLRQNDPTYDAAFGPVASVQGLDVEALVVTSRDADFQVGVIFRGDLFSAGGDGTGGAADGAGVGGGPSAPLITGGVDGDVYPPAPEASLSITMVPDSCFEGRTADDFLDPSEDPIWVLVHDEYTGDAQLFSMTLNGTMSVVCFKDEESAERCSAALRQKGQAGASPRSMMLEDLFEMLGDSEHELCLVDEVVETVLEDVSAAEAAAMPRVVASNDPDELLGTVGPDPRLYGAFETNGSLSGEAVRAMLQELYDGASASEVDGAPPAEER